METRFAAIAALSALCSLAACVGSIGGSDDVKPATKTVISEPLVCDPGRLSHRRLRQQRSRTARFSGARDPITKLKAVPESDGQALFDHSVILWCSQIGYGSHDLANLPRVIAGDANGYFKTGRYLKLPASPKSKRGQPHNDLLVSLANAVDVPITTFGNAACCSGPLAGLR